MSAANWSNRYANAADLADALVALNIVSLHPSAPSALRESGAGRSPDVLDRIADDCDELAELVAKRGNYHAFVVLTDAAHALRMMVDDAESGITTGTFRAIGSSCIAGVSVTEYEGDA